MSPPNLVTNAVCRPSTLQRQLNFLFLLVGGGCFFSKRQNLIVGVA